MRSVITHSEWGIYLGSAMGLGFWSKMDSVGQPEACTFASKQDAIDFIQTWEMNNDPSIYDLVEVSDSDYASVAELKSAGLEDLLGDMEENVLRETPSMGHC